MVWSDVRNSEEMDQDKLKRSGADALGGGERSRREVNIRPGMAVFSLRQKLSTDRLASQNTKRIRRPMLLL